MKQTIYTIDIGNKYIFIRKITLSGCDKIIYEGPIQYKWCTSCPLLMGSLICGHKLVKVLMSLFAPLCKAPRSVDP